MNKLSSLSHIKRTANTRPEISPSAIFIEYVLDRSGSMCSMGDIPTDQTLKFIEDQYKITSDTNTPTFLSLTTFDDKAETWLDNQDIRTLNIPDKDTLKKWIQPRGFTRLYDTSIERLHKLEENVEEYLNNLPKSVKILNPHIVKQFILLTDGLDNDSEYTSLELKNTLIKSRKDGVIGIFLAANQDAIITGQQYGFSPQTSITYSSTPSGAKNVMDAMSNVVRHTSAGSQQIRFSQLERFSSCPTQYPTNNNLTNIVGTPLKRSKLVRQ